MKSVQQLIDEAIIRPDRKRSGKWNPSSFGMCFRQQFWNRKNETPSNPSDARQLRVLAAGQLFHNFVQELICPTHNDGREILVESDDVKGFADIVMENEVIDIKSQHSKSFWYMSKKSVDIKKEKYANWLQVLYYARELRKSFGRLVFISKDDLCIREYVQPLDNYWLRQIDTELTALRCLWKRDELPPAVPRCEPNTKNEYWQCKCCKFKDKCFVLEGK